MTKSVKIALVAAALMVAATGTAWVSSAQAPEKPKVVQVASNTTKAPAAANERKRPGSALLRRACAASPRCDPRAGNDQQAGGEQFHRSLG